MSNKRWLEKLNKWAPIDDRKVTASLSNVKRYCESFEIGDKGICKNYRGYPMMVNRTCSEECSFKINYISAEEFLKQSKKVQKVLLDWWKDNINTLDFYKTRSILCGAIHVSNEEQIKAIKKFIDETIPLLKMDQLIKFIEDKNYFIELNNFSKTKKQVCVYKDLNQVHSSYYGNEEYLIQALWKVAIEIAECQ